MSSMGMKRLNGEATMSRMLSLGLIVLAGVLLGAGVRGAEGEGQPEEELDQIITVDGARIPPTTISKDDYVSVEGKHGPLPAKVFSCNVKEVLYADRDPSYNQAIDQRDLGRYRVAGLYYHKALQNMKEKKWADEYCSYYLGCMFFANGDFNGYKGRSGTEYAPPSVYFKRVLEKNPKTRFLPDLLPKLVRTLAEEGKLAEADAAAKDADAKLKTYQDETTRIASGFDKVIKLARAQLAAAQARLAECKAVKDANPAEWAAARDAWHRVVGQVKDYPELLTEATNSELMDLLKMGQSDAAKNEANNTIEKYRKEGDLKLLPALPGAYTVVGLANYTQAIDFDGKGNKVQAQKLYAEARWAFINVMGQFFDNEDYVAQSYYYAGLCYDKLRDIESDAAEKAVRSWKVVVRDFANTGFKALAEKELQRVGSAPAAAPAAPAAPKPAEPAKKG